MSLFQIARLDLVDGGTFSASSSFGGAEEYAAKATPASTCWEERLSVTIQGGWRDKKTQFSCRIECTSSSHLAIVSAHMIYLTAFPFFNVRAPYQGLASSQFLKKDFNMCRQADGSATTGSKKCPCGCAKWAAGVHW